MHDQHNSPSQQPSQDYGAQDFLHLGEDLEQREREREQAAQSPQTPQVPQAAEGAESWLLDGPEPAQEPNGPQPALPAPDAGGAVEDSAWLMDMGDADSEVSEGVAASGEDGAGRRLEATYLEPESSGEVIGRSLHRSLLPAAAVILLTVAGIGGWKMMGSGPMDSVEPEPIEFKGPRRAQVLITPRGDSSAPRRNGGAGDSTTTSPASAPARQPVAAPSEPSELSNWPSDSEEELADPFELSEGPARSAEAESTLDALDELVAGSPRESVPVGASVAIAVEIAPVEIVVPAATIPVATIPPLNDPAVANGPARASLLPPAAWAMPVGLSTWAGSSELQSDPQTVVELVYPEGLLLDAPLDPVADSNADASDTGEELDPIDTDPIDVWLAAEGTVPFSALAQAAEPDSIVVVEAEPTLDPEAPLAIFAPSEAEVQEPDVSEPDVEVSNADELVAELVVEPEPSYEEPVWQGGFWREYDELSSWSEAEPFETESADESFTLGEDVAVLDEEPEVVSTDEVASVDEEPAEELTEDLTADVAADVAVDSTEVALSEEVAATDGDELSGEALFPWDDIGTLVDEPETVSADEIASVEEPTVDVIEETTEVALSEEVAATDGDELLGEELFPWDDVVALEDEPDAVSTDEVANAEEPAEGLLEVFDTMPEEELFTEVVLEPSPLEETLEPGVELPEFEPLEVLTDLPEDEAFAAAESTDAPAPEGLPALDDALVPEIESGVIDPWVVDEELLAEFDTTPVEAPGEVPGEQAGEADLEAGIVEELEWLAAEAAEISVSDEDPTAVLEDEAAVAVAPDPEVPEEFVDSVDGEWFLGGPIHGPDLPEGYAQLDAEVEPDSQGEVVTPAEDEVVARPKSSLLGNGDLLSQYGHFLRSGRVPQGASPDIEVAVGEPGVTPEEQEQLDLDGVVPERIGLARVDSSQRWASIEVPRHLYGSEERIYTPLVGDVRIELVGGDLLEGQLHSVGSGSVWVDARAGRMQVELDRVVAVQRLGTVGKVVESDPDDRDYSNLPQVRVRTAGGVIVGRQLARDGESVTVLTDGGIRMTLQSMDITPANPRRAVVGLRPR